MGINDYIQIGSIIRSERLKRGYTQKEFSNLVGIPYSTYSNYENNNREPGRQALEKIAATLGISISELLESGKAHFVDTPDGVSEDKPVSFPGLEKKAEEIGYKISYGTYENSDGVELFPGDIIIEYPDEDRLYIDPSDLLRLNDETDVYLKFRFEELRKKKKQK